MPRMRRTFCEGVVEARAKATQVTVTPETLSDPEAFKEFQESQSGLTSALSRLLAVVENYPDLKANQNFLALQAQLEGTENRIAVARRDYIEAVRTTILTLKTFPSVLWATFWFTGNEPFQNFTVAEDKMEAPKVDFGTQTGSADFRKRQSPDRGAACQACRREVRRDQMGQPRGSTGAAALWPSCLPLASPPCACGAELPALTGRVVDNAGMIDPASESGAYVQKLEAFEKKSSDQIVVATIDSLDGEPIEPYANRLFRAWGLGQAGENNGVLLLVAKIRPQDADRGRLRA